MHTSLLNLVQQTEVFLRDHQAQYMSAGRGFNVFSVLDRETDEMKGHSAFLAHLLDPKGSHGQGDNFLRLFFNQDPFLEIGEDANLQEVRVFVEHPCNNRRRLDIVIKGRNFIVGIENKIYAPDQLAQLDDYRDWLNKQSAHAHLFYLTLDGKMPSKESATVVTAEDSQTGFACLSYAETILTWIVACQTETRNQPNVQVVLGQYEQLIRKLVGLPMDDALDEKVSQIISDRSAYMAASTLEEYLPIIRQKVLFRLWEAINAALKLAGIPIQAVSYSKETIRRYLTPNQSSPYFGILMRIKGSLGQDLGLFLTCEKGLFFYVCLLDPKGNPLEKFDDNVCKRIKDRSVAAFHGGPSKNFGPYIGYFGVQQPLHFFHPKTNQIQHETFAKLQDLEFVAAISGEWVKETEKLLEHLEHIFSDGDNNN